MFSFKGKKKMLTTYKGPEGTLKPKKVEKESKENKPELNGVTCYCVGNIALI